MWPAVVGGGATGAGRGQKFSKMQIIKWQPIKYANELCGVARTHSHSHRERSDRRWERVRGGQTAAQHAPQIGRGGTYALPAGE